MSSAGCPQARPRAPPPPALRVARRGRGQAAKSGAEHKPVPTSRAVWSSSPPHAGAADQAGAALAAAAQRAASSAASAIASSAADAGRGALKSVFSRPPTPAAAAPAADVAPLSVTVEQVTAECAALGLVLGERLGKGSRATVFSAVGAPNAPTGASGAWRATPGQAVAVKALLEDVQPATLAELASEAELWGSLDHVGVVRLLHASMTPAPLLVLEACEGGTLFAALRRGDPLDVRTLALDVARALAAVHAAGQAHRDIKSANVLLTRVPSADGGPPRLTAKLCDWGSASLLPNSLPARPLPPAWPSALFGGASAAAGASPVMWTPVGTLLWMAPEMLDPHVEGSPAPRGASGATADVYSFGILLWELLERRLPWVEPVKVKRAEVLRVVIKEGKRLPISDWVATELADLLRQCWLADATKRPTMEQVVARLGALKAWDTDGRLDKLQRATPPTEPPPPGVYNEAVVAAVRTGGKAGEQVLPAASATSTAIMTEEELIALTKSETEPVVELPTAPATVRPPLAPALSAELGALMTTALNTSLDPDAGAEILLSAVLPHAYQLEIGPVFKAELDSLVSKMKATEIRVAQLEERRKFDPLAAVVSDGKRQELEMLTRKVQTMRAEAAVKAWARVAALLSTSSQSAAREYAAARRLLDDAKKASAPKPKRRR